MGAHRLRHQLGPPATLVGAKIVHNGNIIDHHPCTFATLQHRTRNRFMQSLRSINLIRQQLTLLDDVASIRTNILVLLQHSLEAQKNTLGNWEKTHFSNAIAALALNIHGAKQPSYMWLRLCLADLERAMAPMESRDPALDVQNSSIANAKYAHLLDAVNALERELGEKAE